MALDAKFSEKFATEAREHLAALAAALIAIERGADDPRPHVELSMRAAHSIKGGAGLVGLRNIESLAHRVETVLEDIREGRVPVTARATDLLLSAVDRITALVDDLAHSEAADVSAILAALADVAASAGDRGAVASPSAALAVSAAAQPREFPITGRVRSVVPPAGESLYGVKLDFFACERDLGLDAIQVASRIERAGTVIDSRCDVTTGSLRDGLAAPPFWFRAIVSSPRDLDAFVRALDIPCAAVIRLEIPDSHEESGAGRPKAASTPAPRAATASSLRVAIPIIDRVMELAGELALVRNQTLSAATRTAAGQDADVSRRQLLRRLDSVTNELQTAALRMRMQPVAQLFDRFPRLVRDLARQLGKQIDVEITGSEVELDKTVLELLTDPLTHLVRNCCDHGIETPDVRTSLGKPPTGTIRLSARQDRAQIVIEVRDDGKGIDVAAIRRKAVAQGLRTQEELDALEERQVFDLILLSGFSTAANVTDVSGRGVGMDVVKTNVDQAGGSVEIDSTRGQGSIFSLRLPLTLAIMPGQLVSSRGQHFAIPRRELCEVVLCDPNDPLQRIDVSQDQEILRLRSELLPVVRLAQVLDGSSADGPRIRPGPPAREYVAILRVGSHRFGLVVDDLLWSEEIVVKPLHPLLRPLGIYSSTTILADGHVGLILSSEGIARQAGILHRKAPPALPPTVADEAPTEPLLLFRSGPQELFAVPLSDVRRVVMIDASRIERVGGRELVRVEGGTTCNVVRLEYLLDVSPATEAKRVFLILPRDARAPVGILATEIVDTVNVALELDPMAYKVDGVRGSATVRDRLVVILDLARVAQLWANVRDAHLSLPDAPSAAALAQGAPRVLVVEDTQFFQRVIAGHLEGAGFAVVVAGDGAAALDAMARTEFDIVVSDIEMPVMNGFDFAQRVRSDARYRNIPLLALTTLDSPEARGRAKAVGFDGFEPKLERDSLIAHVRQLLAHRSALTKPEAAR
ncbi:MAG: chemotaxis protein CheW [Phycisphaerales bacterium]